MKNQTISYEKNNEIIYSQSTYLVRTWILWGLIIVPSFFILSSEMLTNPLLMYSYLIGVGLVNFIMLVLYSISPSEVILTSVSLLLSFNKGRQSINLKDVTDVETGIFQFINIKMKDNSNIVFKMNKKERVVFLKEIKLRLKV